MMTMRAELCHLELTLGPGPGSPLVAGVGGAGLGLCEGGGAGPPRGGGRDHDVPGATEVAGTTSEAAQAEAGVPG